MWVESSPSSLTLDRERGGGCHQIQYVLNERKRSQNLENGIVALVSFWLGTFLRRYVYCIKIPFRSLIVCQSVTEGALSCHVMSFGNLEHRQNGIKGSDKRIHPNNFLKDSKQQTVQQTATLVILATTGQQQQHKSPWIPSFKKQPIKHVRSYLS